MKKKFSTLKFRDMLKAMRKHCECNGWEVKQIEKPGSAIRFEFKVTPKGKEPNIAFVLHKAKFVHKGDIIKLKMIAFPFEKYFPGVHY